MINRDFNTIIMQEVGLDVDERGYIIDQDNGNKLQFKGKYIKSSDAPIGRNDVKFDPLNNVNMMGNIFSYFTNKITEEEGRYVDIFYQNQPEKNAPGSMTVKIHNRVFDDECCEFIEDGPVSSADVEIIESKKYVNTALQYADLILNISGDTMTDLSEFDKKEEAKKRGKK